MHAARPWKFYQKKFFRVARARFDSVLPVTPVALCLLRLIVKRLRLRYVRQASETPQRMTGNLENFQRFQSFRTLENILHTFFANSL